jgi:hypothetical protein
MAQQATDGEIMVLQSTKRGCGFEEGEGLLYMFTP